MISEDTLEDLVANKPWVWVGGAIESLSPPAFSERCRLDWTAGFSTGEGG